MVQFSCTATSKHTTKGFFYKALYPWLGRGLLTADGELWHTRRHLLTPTFHFSILNGFSDVMNEQANVFVSQLAKEADTGKTFDIFHYVTLCALDIIMETAMGVKLGAQVAGKENDYVQAIYSLTTMLAERGRRPWLLIDFIRDLSSEGKKEKQYLQVLHGRSRHEMTSAFKKIMWLQVSPTRSSRNAASCSTSRTQRSSDASPSSTSSSRPSSPTALSSRTLRFARRSTVRF